jgi:octaprenyl-diphosphate synthase
MTAHVSRFRGKELRGALVLLAGDATGNATDEHPAIAAIVEMIHLATLVHDDVLDGAKVRRRVACVNERWDNQTAVLLGDFLYARAFALSTDLSSRLASRVLAETTRRICVSEIEQAARRFDFDLPEAAYETISGGKTASLYSAACELGARYPGGREEAGLLLRKFGWEIGLAFQIVDDCLDCAGQTVETGKIAGTDLREGIPTLPLLLAAQEDEVVRKALAGGSLDGALLRVGASGAIEEARQVARNYAEKALACLDGLEARHELEAIAEAVVDRTA